MSEGVFVATIRLKTNQQDKKYINKLSECARMLYNAVLGETQKRHRRIKNDKLYKETIQIPKATKEGKKQRNKNFKKLNNFYGFSDYSLQAFDRKTPKRDTAITINRSIFIFLFFSFKKMNNARNGTYIQLR